MDYRASIEIYIKELAKHLCSLDYKWVKNAFKHTLVSSLEALSMKKEDWIYFNELLFNILDIN